MVRSSEHQDGVEVLAHGQQEVNQSGSVHGVENVYLVDHQEAIAGQGSQHILKANLCPVSGGLTKTGEASSVWRRGLVERDYLIGGANLRMLPLNCVLPPWRQSGPKMFINSQI